MDFEALAGKKPEDLTEEERYRLGISFYDASRRRDQQIATQLGATSGDAMRIAIKRAREGAPDEAVHSREQSPDATHPSQQ